MAGIEKMLLMGFPLHAVDISGVPDKEILACCWQERLTKLHGIKQSSQALGQMAGNAMHLRAIAVALCCALKAGDNLWSIHFTDAF